MKKTTLNLILIAGFLGFVLDSVNAQNVSIGKTGGKPSTAAILDLKTGNVGSNLGFLPAQVGLSATNSALPINSPDTGLIVYNTVTGGVSPHNVVPGYYYWNGSVWELLLAPGAGTNGYVLTSSGGGAPVWAPAGSSNYLINGNGINGTSYNGAGADTWSVAYGSVANTAVEGNTAFTVNAGTGMSGGGSITEGVGGTLTMNNNGVTGITGTLPVTASSSVGGVTLGVLNNGLNSAGVVSSGNGNVNEVWGTDGGGNPLWRGITGLMFSGGKNIQAGLGSSVVVTNGTGQVTGMNNVSIDIEGTKGGIYYGSGGGNAALFTGSGSVGQLLVSGGAGEPVWVNANSALTTSNIVSGVNSVVSVSGGNGQVVGGSNAMVDIRGAVGNSGGVLYSNGASSAGFSVQGTGGEVMVSNGASGPSWATMSSLISTNNVTSGTTGVTITNGVGQVVGGGNMGVNIAGNSVGSAGLAAAPSGGNMAYIADGSGNPKWGMANGGLATNNVTTGTSGVMIGNGNNQVVGSGNLTIDVATNSKGSAGLAGVPGGDNYIYMTDGSGNPQWGIGNSAIVRGDVTTSTNGVTIGNGNGQVVGGGGMSIDVMTNSAVTAGLVPAPGKANWAYVTDGSGNPLWAKVNNALAKNNLTEGAGSSVVVMNGNGQVVGGTNASIDIEGTSGGIYYGNGAGNGASFTGAGTAGQVLISGGAGAPEWVNANGAVSSTSISGKGSVVIAANSNSILGNTPLTVDVEGKNVNEGGVFYSNGSNTSALFSATGAAGYILQSNGTSAPSWVNLSANLTSNAANVAGAGGGSSVVIGNGNKQVLGPGGVTIDVQGLNVNEGGVFYSTGLGTPAAFSSAGTSGEVLLSNGTGAPSWTNFPSLISGSALGSVNNSVVVVKNGSGQLVGVSGASMDVEGTNGNVGGVLYSTGAGAPAAFSSSGTSGQLLQSNGTGAPTWTTNLASVINGSALGSANNSVVVINNGSGQLLGSMGAMVDVEGSGGDAGGILYSKGANTSAAFLAAGTAGYILKSNGNGAPTWVAPIITNANVNGIDKYVVRYTPTGKQLGTGVMQDDSMGVSISADTLTAVNMLDVGGGEAIGKYAGSSIAPANGLIVSGNVGIGNKAPGNNLMNVSTATVSSSSGYDITLTGQTGATSNTGGGISITGGAGGVAGQGGAINITAGGAGNFANGSNVNIAASGSLGNFIGNGGNIVLTTGNATQSGVAGGVGIGTNSPKRIMEIGGNGNTERIDELGNGGTTYNQPSGVNVGDLLYANDGNGDLWSLPGGKSNNAVLTSNGSGVISWGTLPSASGVTAVSGVLPVVVTPSDPNPVVTLEGTNGGVFYGTGSGSAVTGTSGTTGYVIEGSNNGAPQWAGLGSLPGGAGILPIENGGTGISNGPTGVGQYLRSSAFNTWAVSTIQVNDVAALVAASGLYVDLSTGQSATGQKTWSGSGFFTGGGTGVTVSNNEAVGGTLGVTGMSTFSSGITETGGTANINALGANGTNIGNGTNVLSENGDVSINGSNGGGTTSIGTGSTTGLVSIGSSGGGVGIGNTAPGSNLLNVSASASATGVGNGIIETGQGGASGSGGGGIAYTGGAGGNGGAGGTATIAGGAGGSGGSGGGVNIIAGGTVSGSVSGSNVNITGSSASTKGNGGNIVIQAGVSAGKKTANGGVAINSSGNGPDGSGSAVLDIASSSMGVLFPRMTTAQMTTLGATATTGLMIYNTTTNCLMFYANSGWQPLGCQCSGAPLSPGTINGAANGICQSSGTTTLSVAPIAGATSYTWSCSSTNVVLTQTIAGTPTVTATGTVVGTYGVSITATNSCGTSAATTDSLRIFNVNPAKPGVITALALKLCAGTTGAFSVAPTANTGSYIWTVTGKPAASITGGQGTNTVSITFPDSGGNYTLKVAAENSCKTVAGISPLNFSSSSYVKDSLVFAYTGAIQDFTIPCGVTTVTITTDGASGGNSGCGGSAGLGAQMIGTFKVNPGEVLQMLIGQQGPSSNSRGGGGGGTFVFDSTTGTLLIVAGGGGGGGQGNTAGGVTTTAAQPGGGQCQAGGGGTNGGGGGGGNDGAGGGGGGYIGDGGFGTACNYCGSPGAGGNGTSGGNASGCGGCQAGGGLSFKHGGTGGICSSGSAGGYGGGGGAYAWNCGGGGGGGYSGGGGGCYDYQCSNQQTCGGGGGSYNIGTNQNNTAGTNQGNGQVIIQY